MSRVTVVALLCATIFVVVGLAVVRDADEQIDPEAVSVGTVGDFPPGSVTEIGLGVGIHDSRGVEDPDARAASIGFLNAPRIFVVADEEEGLLAFLARSPWRGCRVAFVSASVAASYGHQVPNFEEGFLDPCHGGLFGLDGAHLAGPGWRGLDGFPVAIQPDGTVVVDITRIVGG